MSPFNQWTAVTLLDNFDLSYKISLHNSWNESVLPSSHPCRSWNNSSPVQKIQKATHSASPDDVRVVPYASADAFKKVAHEHVIAGWSTLRAQYHWVKNQVANHSNGSDGSRKKKKKKVDVTCLNDVKYKKNHVPWTQLQDFDKSEI